MTRTARQERGNRGEELARRHLLGQGYTIEATNVRCKAGELDIVAQEGKTLCFIEVRLVTSSQFGSAAASIDVRKRRHVLQAARWYIAGRRPRWEGPFRFDVVAIDQVGSAPTVTLIRNAFDAADASPSWW